MNAFDRRLRSTLLVVCATGLAACGVPKSIIGSNGNEPAEPSTAQSPHQSGTDTTEDPRVVKVVLTGSEGTGWVYAEGVVVTAAHVIRRGSGRIEVQVVDGEPRTASLRSGPEGSQHDITVLCVKDVADPAWRRRGVRSVQTCDLLGTLHYPNGTDQQQRCCPVLAPRSCCPGTFATTGFWATEPARDEPTFVSRQGFFVQRFDAAGGEFGHTLDTERESSGAPIFAPCGSDDDSRCLVGMHVGPRPVKPDRVRAGEPHKLVQCEDLVGQSADEQGRKHLYVNIGVDIETIDAFVKDVLSKKPCP